MITLRILVVEDEFSLADIMRIKLKKENYDVDISLDGEEGLDKSLSGIYDLIILDIMLPKINGIEILREIRRNDIDTKVIMLTAKGTLDDKLVGFENGAKDFDEIFIQSLLIMYVMGLFDRFFVDWYWVEHTKVWDIPNTEELKPYIPKKIK